MVHRLRLAIHFKENNMKISRNQYLKVLVFFLAFGLRLLYGQCGTISNCVEDQNPIPACENLANIPINDCPLIFKTYVHVIRDNNGNGGLSEAMVQQVLNTSFNDFEPHNIFFEVISIDDLHRTKYMDQFATPSKEEQIDLWAEHPDKDGIHIYLARRDYEMPQIFGVAEAIPSFGVFVIGNEAAYQSNHMLTHELGHALGLYHTFRGFNGHDSNDVNGCEEGMGSIEMPASNCLDCGDCVCDTPVDPYPCYIPNLPFSDNTFNFESCQYITGPGPLIPNIPYHNFMSYYTGPVDPTNPNLGECRNEFTPLQIERIRKIIQFQDASLGLDYTFMQEGLIDEIYITENTTWNEPRKVCYDVIIEAPARLTITSTITIAENIRFVVKPGADLFIDGGLLTNGADGYWKGIEVWGDASQPQIPVNGQQIQGFLKLMNGAIVEYAQEAITVFNPNPDSGPINATTGGYVIASDSYFLNNERCVEFRPYEGSGLPYNLSSFTNCLFTLNNTFNGNSFSEHVKLKGVRGIGFTGCTFSNLYPGFSVNQSLGRGIYSEDAHFNVGGNSIFTGLYRGIQVGNAFSSKNFKVQSSTFDGNEIGILAQGVNHFRVTNCDFVNIGNFNGPSESITFEGIQLEGCSGFIVWDNTFYGLSGLTQNNTVGMKIIDSGTAGSDTYIFRNTFDHLWVGNATEGNNGDDVGGLVFECNTNLGNNIFDFSVMSGSIKEYQIANSLKSAGNLFSLNSNNSESDFKNLGANFVYFHYQVNNNGTPEDYSQNSIFLIPRGPNDCVDLIPSDVPFPPTAEGEIIYEDLSDELPPAQSDYDVYRSNLANKLDDGGTADLINDITSASTSQGKVLEDRLLKIAPYVSREVLERVVGRRDIFTEPMLFNILSANPEVLRKNGFREYLERRKILVPEKMDLLYEKANELTERGFLEAKIATTYSRVHLIANTLITHHLMEPGDYDLEIIRTYLEEKKNLGALYEEVLTYLEEENGNEARRIMDQIQKLFTLSEEQLNDYNRLSDLVDLKINLIQSKRSLWELSNVEIKQLETIAANSGKGATVAKNILSYILGYNYEANRNLPKILVNGNPKRFVDQSIYQATFIKAFPNPVKEELAFSYQLPDGIEKGEIVIHDLFGEIRHRLKVYQKKGIIKWHNDRLPVGIYLYSLKVEGQLIETQKMIICE